MRNLSVARKAATWLLVLLAPPAAAFGVGNYQVKPLCLHIGFEELNLPDPTRPVMILYPTIG